MQGRGLSTELMIFRCRLFGSNLCSSFLFPRLWVLNWFGGGAKRQSDFFRRRKLGGRWLRSTYFCPLSGGVHFTPQTEVQSWRSLCKLDVVHSSVIEKRIASFRKKNTVFNYSIRNWSLRTLDSLFSKADLVISSVRQMTSSCESRPFFAMLSYVT